MIRLAIIGTNFVTDWLVEAVAETSGIEISAVYSRTQSRADEYAAKHNIQKTFTDLHALASDPDIDAVYIASPNKCHAEQAIMMLNAKKHVLCEKPMAPDSQTLAEMLSAANTNQCILMEAMVTAHMPCYQNIPEIVKPLGKLRRATLQFCQYSSRYDKFKSGIVENAFDPTLCNGALMDIGVYCIHVLYHFFGIPTAVAAAGIMLPNSIDGEGTIIASYEDKVGECIYSKITQGYAPSQIQGENGVLLLDALTRPNKWTLRLRDGTETVLDVKPEKHPMHYEVADFVAQIHGISMPQYNIETIEVLKIMDKARSAMGIDFQKHI